MELTLRHVVGRSTLKEGFTIPRAFQDWVGAPPRGCKRQIALVFDGQSIPATLRRVDNDQGNVQVRYGNRDGRPFRVWLATVFSRGNQQATGGFLELRRLGPDCFEVVPFPTPTSTGPSLRIDQWLFHRGAETLLDQDTPLAEIPVIVNAVPFVPEESQSFYNQAISEGFRSWNWQSERRVVPELGLKCDFRKDGVQAEVEFGNARVLSKLCELSIGQPL